MKDALKLGLAFLLGVLLALAALDVALRLATPSPCRCGPSLPCERSGCSRGGLDLKVDCRCKQPGQTCVCGACQCR